MTVIQGESVRLTRIVDDLFLLARVDAGGPIVTRDIVELPDLAIDAVRSVRSIATARGITVTCDLAPSVMEGPVLNASGKSSTTEPITTTATTTGDANLFASSAHQLAGQCHQARTGGQHGTRHGRSRRP